METWGVDEVAQWLESCDMVGPAAYFRSQGVGGLDLVTFSSEQHLARVEAAQSVPSSRRLCGRIGKINILV